MSRKRLRHTATWIPAKHFKVGRSAPIQLIVLHTAETGETTGAARAVGNYFKNNKIATSGHYCVDNREVVQCVNEEDTAWCAPPCNSNGIHIEMAGRAGQTASQWKDQYSKDLLRLTSLLVAELFVKYDHIPVRQLSADKLKRGWAGITGHVDISKAFRQSDHTDPGVNFPWKSFMEEVRVNVRSLGA